MNKIKVNIKVDTDVYSNCKPEYAHIGDSGMDVRASKAMILSPGSTNAIPTGLYFEIPFGYEIQIRPKSGLSLNTKLRVSNTPGSLDHGFSGEVKVIVDNIGTSVIEIKKGDKIAQAVLCPVCFMELELVDNIQSETTRGENGFGSTGN